MTGSIAGEVSDKNYCAVEKLIWCRYN